MESNSIQRMTWSLTDENNYLTRKLAHYNAWLTDPKRKFGTIYPGFPEEHPAVVAEKAAAAAAPKPAAKPKADKPKAKAEKKAKSAGGSKQDRALEIFREFSGDRKLVIAAIQDRLAMSAAGATTYFYNAKKLAA